MEKIVLCFDVDNKQEDYSALMQIIESVENGTELRGWEELRSMCNIRYCWLRGKNAFINSQLDMAKKIEAEIAGKNKEQGWSLYPLQHLEQVVEKRSSYDYRYYVRVHTDDDVKNAQYTILLLQQFQIVNGRIGFFFVPFTNYYSAESLQWKQKSIYYKYSHFLRFILLKYKQTFLGAYYNFNMGQVEISPLSSKKVGVQSSFFPLMEIDQSILSAITKYFVFGTKQTVSDGTSILGELLEISEKILFTRLKNGGNKKTATIKIGQITQALSHEHVTVLEHAVFCGLIPEDGELTEDMIKGSMRSAQNIADGLIQIIENIVLHSYNHKGIFTFRIMGHNDRVLEIDVSDANRRETIIDNFKEKLGNAMSYFNDIPISISHFFGVFSEKEEEQAWKAYRSAYPVKCLGLQRLAQELERCKASFRVRSNTEYRSNREELLYAVNRNQEIKNYSDLYIPGTQYQILIPISQQYIRLKQHNANVFLNAIGGLLETDAVYAKFIDYHQENIKFEDICLSKKNIIEADMYYYNMSEKYSENRKEQMVGSWRNGWATWVNKINIKENSIYCLDLRGIRELISPWGIEAFCKGLVGSAVLNHSKIKYLALINSSEELMKMLFETIRLSNVQWNKQLQLYIHIDDNNTDMLICGNSTDEIIRNAFQYCFSKGKILDFLPKCIDGEIEQSIELCPFDVLLKQEGCDKTLFEKYIENVADELLTSEDMAGYRLMNSHMRLGNKVHLGEFYELSILFRKPHISKKIALLLIRDMIKEDINVMQNLLFYGYASYSRTILISLVEIMKQYHLLHKEENYFLGFAVYQNDIVIQKTLTDISPKVRMYFSADLPERGDVTIVQIVPISTTLTTFKKMWDMFCEEMTTRNRPSYSEKNYTLFWVRDLGDERHPTEIEEEYWTEIKENKTVATDLIKTEPKFFCCKKKKWFNPLSCECCYPKNVLDEIALIETDVTSTVPSQQLEVMRDHQGANEQKITEEEKCNEIRIINLQDCVYYGHISRDGNHFQYYIDTVAYFQKQKKEIEEWLKGKAIQDKEKAIGKGILNIIITPHHHTNVEFGHYVNEYYFNGTADIITIDPSKEYRSNIMVKYADIKKTISDAYRVERDVRFVYVDDSIITGTTFKRVNNLLHSLVPEERINLLQIDKVFVLVNRMSLYSKLDYVQNMNEDFYAFVNLNISSIRNYGDSCTMCTLQRNAHLFHKRASTFSMTKYWDDKQEDYIAISFDKYNDKEKMEKGYIRMLCSHYAKSNLNITENMASNICSIMNLMLDLEKEQVVSPIYNMILLKNRKKSLQAYLKILVRPFFSYGRIYRQAIMDLLLLVAEYFLNGDFKNHLMDNRKGISEKKQYMNDRNLREQVLLLCHFIEETIPENERIDFIQIYLLEGLTDLRSNYIIRKVTLEHMHELVSNVKNSEAQYDTYSQMVHRLINSSADETKSLWFEYLLTTGDENRTGMKDYHEITLAKSWKTPGNFQKFWETLFIENTRLCYDSMLNFVKKAESMFSNTRDNSILISNAVKSLWGDYYIRNLRRFIKIEILAENYAGCKIEYIEQEIQRRAEKMTDLLWLLKTEMVGGLERYDKLKSCVEQLLSKGEKLQIFTMAEDELCPVTDYKKGVVSHENAEQIKHAVDDEYFKKKGFYIGSDYIIICISNYSRDLEKQIQPLYFYIQCQKHDTYQMILRVRKILMYRNQILHWIEADFNNNALPVLVEQMSANRQLMRDKAGDHSSRTDISAIERLLQTEYNRDILERLYRLMLLRQYVNMRIARIFRSEWSKDSQDTRDKLYTLKTNADGMNGPMTNLGKSIFGKTIAGGSPAYYIEAIFDMFEFTIHIDDETHNIADMETMKTLFDKMNGREENGYYYKQEYIICIILDILFSAIRTCRNWPIDYDDHAKQLKQLSLFNGMSDLRCLIKEDEMMTCFERLSTTRGKCKIRIERNSAYLIFRNMVEGMEEYEVEKGNKALEEQFRTKETKGLSLQTIKWYVESVENAENEENKKVSFKYEWNSEIHKVEFVTKLPILREE